MSEDETKMEEWMYDFAWKGRDIAQQANDRLDLKAMNIITFSGFLIPIITGVLFFGIEKNLISVNVQSMFIVSIFLLIISILTAFLTVWGRDQGILRINEHFDKCSGDIAEIYGLTARRIGNWQKQIIEVGVYKNRFFLISSVVFIISLLFITYAAYLVIFS